GPKDSEVKPDVVVQANGTKAKSEPIDSGKGEEKEKEEAKGITEKKGGDDQQTTDQTNPGKRKKGGVGKESDLPAVRDVAFGPPNPRQIGIGHYVPDPKETSILLQAVPDNKIEWKRLTSKQSEVYSARPLLSLPASRGVVETDRGVRLKLWGTMPEFIAAIPGLFESLVEIYSSDGL